MVTNARIKDGDKRPGDKRLGHKNVFTNVQVTNVRVTNVMVTNVLVTNVRQPYNTCLQVRTLLKIEDDMDVDEFTKSFNKSMRLLKPVEVRKLQKKVLFLVARPLRPSPPPPRAFSLKIAGNVF